MNLPKQWRLKGQRYRLEGQRHSDGRVRFPAQPAKLGEASDAWQPYQLANTGELYSWTAQRSNHSEFDHEPIVLVGMIKLADGCMLTAQLTDCEPSELQIGMAMEAVTRSWGKVGEDDLLVYGYKFRPKLVD